MPRHSIPHISPEHLATASAIMWDALSANRAEVFLTSALVRLSAACDIEAGVFLAAGGKWTQLAATGAKMAPPWTLLGESLDADTVVVEGPWSAAPFASGQTAGSVIVGHSRKSKWDANRPQVFEELAALCGEAYGVVRSQEAGRRRLVRLEAMLAIAGRWYQTHDMHALLVQMAEAATQLLDADRASIFLWDRANRQLLARPALGVEGQELALPDDAGVVGRVLKEGYPLRVNAAERDDPVYRQIDKSLGYRTRTLVCVPLVGRDGERLGVFEALNKKGGDFTDDDEATLVELAAHAAIALENTKERSDLIAARRQLSEEAAGQVRMIGESPAIAALRSTVRRVADTDLAVLILGENGTGKEVVSQMTHYLSPRRDRPFLAVNCAALSETLLESELFGHEKGAFTDAHEMRAGKFETASGGTLFLDEIGELSTSAQAKLLRVLEEKVVVRVGGSKSIATDVRVVAATNQDLGEMVRQKRFRQDLYFRLNVVTLQLPPLRDRGDDVLLLAEHFLSEFSQKARRKPPILTAASKRRLLEHPWPGNIRELRNLMERLAFLSTNDRVEPEDLAFILAPEEANRSTVAAGQPLAEATQQFQSQYIGQAVERARGNVSAAAKQLGLHRSNLYRKMRQLGMVDGEGDQEH